MPTVLTAITVRLRTMRLASGWPVATTTAAVAASMPPRRKNCHGRSPASGSAAADAAGAGRTAARPASVEISELIVEPRLEFGVLVDRRRGRRLAARPLARRDGDA